MFILDILEIPFEFIKENLTGWVIVILVILIIYFVCLRNYYLQKERFYDQSMYEKNIKDVENAEKDILVDEERNSNDNIKSLIKKNNKLSSKKVSSKVSSKVSTKVFSKDLNTRNQLKENSDARKKMQNINNIDNDFNQTNDDTNNTNENTKIRKNNTMSRNTNTVKGKTVIEGFDNTNTTIPLTTKANGISGLPVNNAMSYIATTLFDNLNLTPAQIQSCKLEYNEVIAQYIVDLGKLAKIQSKNPYLNTSKQYDLIIAKGIDNIINYLNNTIKSYNILTRTSIRTDVVNTLSSVLENLINKNNNELSNEMTTLASLNSTTIDYATQLSTINTLREQLEEYIEIDKLVSNYSHNINNSTKEINSILDKSFILPIYERNFDKIKQLVNSDFNDDENNLADKYSKAYMDFLEEKKKEELDINPMRLASQIESGIVSFLTGLSNKTDKNKNNSNSNNKNILAKPLPEYGNISGDNYDYTNNSLREQYTRQYGYLANFTNNLKNNPIPSQESKLLNETPLNASNIIEDSGNRGSYLINKQTQKDILEGFETDVNTNITTTLETQPLSTSPNLTKAINNSNNANTSTKKKKQNSTDIISNLVSTNFLQYIMDYMSDKINVLFQFYNNKMSDSNDGSHYGNRNNTNGYNNSFNLEENMIPAGFLLFILSMLFYFVDTTSTS